ncbi:MAG TPA: SDR family NAD(P)-dependent oxidoreductase [Elusimicrobiota bacterium]|nr:SDR family NAD(P)-dependent oxidoreductase [Elusimicrobiota bacterium]
MNWKNVRVVVTGAGGFIGSHLTEELARRGAKVRALVHYNSRGHWGFLEELDAALKPRVEIVAGDVADPNCVAELVKGSEAVFHLAALIAIPYSYAAPASYVSTNITGTLNVLEACRRWNVGKLVQTSTSETYGTAQFVPITEEHPLQAQSPYAATKVASDQLALSFEKSFGLPVAVCRPFNTYGPRQSARAVIPTIACQLLQETPVLKIGSLSPVRDFNFVGDTVDGFLSVAAAKAAVGEVINIGSGRGVTIGQTAKLLMKITGRRAEIQEDRARVRPERSEVMRLICGNKKALKLTGWKPRVPLEQGLARTAEYVRAHLSDYKAGLYNV